MSLDPKLVDALRQHAFAVATMAAKEGESALTMRLVLVAEELAGWLEGKRLKAAESSDNLQSVTGAQLQRRGRAIAKAKSAKSDDPLWAAITSSKWGSQERYAKDRLKVSPGSLSAYRSGATPCPRSVALKIQGDLGVGLDYWTKPRSLVD